MSFEQPKQEIKVSKQRENNVIEGEPPPKRPRIENETTKTEKLQATQEGEATLSVETEEKKPIEEIPKTEEKKPIEEIPKTEEKNLSEIQEKTLISTTQPPEVPKETKTEVPAEESAPQKQTEEVKREETVPKIQSEGETKILEKGLIYFFYRPRVSVTEVKSSRDVQRFYLLLCPGIGKPESTEQQDTLKRLIVVGNKKLPSPESKARFWGFVEKVGQDVQKIIQENLGEMSYRTPTSKQKRTLSRARPAGRGVYAIITHNQHTHLVYVLEVPESDTLGPVQRAFNIEQEASVIVSVKNPNIGSSKKTGPSKNITPQLPPQLLQVFGQNRWTDLNPVSLLDYEGMELIFIGATSDIVQELGSAGKRVEETAAEDVKTLSLRKVLNELNLHRTEKLTQPLLEGEWK